MTLYILLLILGLILIAFLSFPLFYLLLLICEMLLSVINISRSPKFLLMMFRNLRRNLARTMLSYVAVFSVVIVITCIWSILSFLDLVTSEKSKDLKAIVTEKFQIPSQMPYTYAENLRRDALSLPTDLRPQGGDDDLMTWGFYGGTLDAAKRTRENVVFFFVMEPRKLMTMMDDLDRLPPAQDAQLRTDIKEMEENLRGVILGKERLKAMNKQVGERFKVTSLNFKDIDLEFEIVGEFPQGRYDQNAIMNREYLNRALEAYKQEKKVPHPMAEKSLNLFWMRLPTTEAFGEVAEKIADPGKYSGPSVKAETASSGISTFLDAYRDLIWGMRWLLSPALLVTMTLVIAVAISITVRERRTEMAVLKVLGYRPWQIMVLCLGEALLVGGISGLMSSGLTYLLINYAIGGLKFPMAFFPAFYIPAAALWWGPVLGFVTALLGSILPAWSARTVKVSEVFSKIA